MKKKIETTVTYLHLELHNTLRKKVEPKRLHPGADLENGATLQGGAVFPLNNHVYKNSSTFVVWLMGLIYELLVVSNQTIEDGTKIVPGVELTYVPWLHFFSQCTV